ncbi:signal transduction histidine kinase [Thermocatellispora tengchongensis]|uniref:histidine kinase n=1 Tax=Thermocatellispora tengchongensis TaxID=1073253 RepID=A0A840NPI3_9ACTN|nr:sensor histidine kinase [Thermocatellispora tengchongensis]MBB5130434.1 signal transduction histidine kinase [Thermocatellispora tengchongensis]
MESRVALFARRSAAGMAGGLVLAAFGLALLPVTAVVTLLMLLSVIGLVFPFPPAVRLSRWQARLGRRITLAVTGVDIDEPYRPRPAPPVRQPDGWYRADNRLYKKPTIPAYTQRLDWLLKDPATWRDLLWGIGFPLGAAPAAAIPAAMLLYGAASAVASGSLAGVALAVAGAALGPWTLRAAGLWNRALLAPTQRARLAGRVRDLAESRSQEVDAQAAQLRRIERDLHDGAQARLVAVGMTLGAAERLLDTDPAAAIALIGKAQEASATALAELRRLVRGIRPPVLAERGLADALRALAVDSALDVTVTIDAPGERCGEAVEAAVYFAVSELLTNAARHGGATSAAIDMTVRRRELTVVVRDDGSGGADPARGSGLRGIERRLTALDGTFTLDSPPGEPTVATLSVPEALAPEHDPEPEAPERAAAPSPSWNLRRVTALAGACLLVVLPLLLPVAAYWLVPALAVPSWPAAVTTAVAAGGALLLAGGIVGSVRRA